MTFSAIHRLFLAVVCVVITATPVVGQSPDDGSGDGGERSELTNAPVVVVLPFIDYTGAPDARGVCNPILLERLSAMPVQSKSGTTVRDILRTHRIRAVGGISTTGAEALRRDLSAAYALTGSYDVFRGGNSCPEVAISIRLVDLRSMQVRWARSTGATCDDFETVLGLGRYSDVTEVASRVIDDAIHGLENALERDGTRDVSLESAPAVVVVPFEDIVLESPGSGAVTAHVLSQLVERGFSVIEPGAARELYLEHQTFPMGEIDLESLEALHSVLGATYVVTGLVDEFRLRYPNADVSFPRLRLSGRVIDAATGRIIRMADVSGDGDREIILGWGRVHAVADLTRSCTSTLLNRLHLKEGRRDVRP